MTTVTQPSFTAEFAVGYRDLMAGALAHERTITKRVVAAIPEHDREYRPDPNSRTAMELATHLLESDIWFLNSISGRNFQWDPSKTLPVFESPKEAIAFSDEHFQPGFQRVMGMNPAELLTQVDFFGMMRMPVFTYLLFANNHHVHHRAQLSTYLRAMGGRVPNIYGGSFDEPMSGGS